MLWAVYCIDKPDTVAIRNEHLQVHRRYLDEKANEKKAS